jgi:predicted nuclease of restriction endonuclease-like (RecB) superfamily
LGKSVVADFSAFIQSHFLGIRGFSPQNIWRMKQLYETYRDNEKLSTLSREISWSNNVLIFSGVKSAEAREFYMLDTQKNNYTACELESQIDSRLFERIQISGIRNEQFLARSPVLAALRDNFVLEFLVIPENHKEFELRKAIRANLRDFILEFGKDFSLIDEEYRIQVGNTDFRIDLLLLTVNFAVLLRLN